MKIFLRQNLIAFIVLLIATTCAHARSSEKTTQPKKPWTIIVYIAADNDLRGFAARNIKQMAAIGSNSFCNICVELHMRISGNKKISRRYYIEQNNIVHVNALDPNTQKMDSGDPKTLVKCCGWAIEDYPADNYALILWNHGTGIIDPTSGRIINANELFAFNPVINKLELDRSVGFLDFLEMKYGQDERGICWDDSTGNYLNNQKLEAALHEIQTIHLKGQKLSILGFDACLMSMLEVANIAKKHAHILVSSQEVELGTGWNYQLVLQPFMHGALDRTAFARHIVQAYNATYQKITDDFTLSALDLNAIDALESNVSMVGALLAEGLRRQQNNSIRQAISLSRDKSQCTHFDEPSYLDLHHLYSNLLTHLNSMHLGTESDSSDFRAGLAYSLREGCSLIKRIALANTTGKNLHLAHGISIYFPENRIHYSYRKTNFAATNEWANFLTHYLIK